MPSSQPCSSLSSEWPRNNVMGKCVCALTNPGSKALPLASVTASALTFKPSPIFEIFPFSTRTLWFESTSRRGFCVTANQAFFISKDSMNIPQIVLYHFSYCLWLPANTKTRLLLHSSKQILYWPASTTKNGKPCSKCRVFPKNLSCCIFFIIGFWTDLSIL